MDKEIVFTVLLAVLVLASALQTYQLVNLQDKVKTGSVSVKLPAASAPQTSGGAAAPATDLSNLPQMVGGC